MRNLKTVICRNLNLVNAEVWGRTRQMSVWKIPKENKQLLTVEKSRCFHDSKSNLSEFKGVNQKAEERKNYIFVSIICGICLSMFLFSLTMRTHEDYVFINPDPKKK